MVNFFKILFPLLMFDFIETLVDWDDQSLIHFNTEAMAEFQKRTLAQTQDLDYSSHNSIQLLNTISFVIYLYLLTFIAYLFVRLYLLLFGN